MNAQPKDLRLVALGLGVVGLALWVLLAALGQQAMPSYLAAWLFWMALPIGALPVVMLMELLDVQDWAIESVLRRLLLLMLPGAVFALPLVIGGAPLFHRAGLQAELPDWWMQPRSMLVRMAVMLLIWVGLALLFCRTPRQRPRRAMAIIGLLLHLVVGSVAALDWIMSLDPGIASSAFGLLVMLAQTGTALCGAAFIVAVATRGETDGRTLPGEVAPLLAVAAGAWAFLHFIQYLSVWSANLPHEVVWYQSRTLGFGVPAVWFGFVAMVVAIVVLLAHRVAATPWVMASVSAMLLLAHLVEMQWLVTPAFRGAFVAAWPDLPALLGLGGLAVFMLSMVRNPGDGARHANA